MTPELFVSATMFAVATSFTPGPNNAMLLASGVNYGFRQTLPHIAGVTIGYGVMFAAVALGVGQFIFQHPPIHDALRVGCGAYLIWLAWRIATASGEVKGATADRPQTFFEAAMFQWINPKGVAAALTASATYVDAATIGEDLAVLSAMLVAVSLASTVTWALFGQALRGYLAVARRRRLFNYAMAIALLASLWPLLALRA